MLGSADYTSTSGTSVVLAQGASVSDLVVIVVYDVFSVADTVSKTSGGSFDSAVTVNGDLTIKGSNPATIVESTTSSGAFVQFKNTNSSNTNRLGYAVHDFVVDTNGNEALRIDSSGKLLVGTTSANGDGLSLMPRYSESGTTSQIRWNRANVSGTGTALLFQNNSSTVGSISHNNSSTTYATSSDYRLKESVTYDFDATTRLKQLKPCRFNFIVDADTTVDGFLAHEVSSVVPEAVSGTKDATETYTDDDGNEQTRIAPQGIDQSKLVPLLVKTIQELEARIKALESA